MREVSGCDFCGGTPSGTFDVLPPEYDPEGKGKRMVLCDHCRDALASILDPLLDAKADDVEPQVDTDSEPAEPTEEPADAATAVDEIGVGTTTDTDTESAADETGSGTTTDADEAEGADDRTGDAAADEADDESTGPRMAKTADGTSSRVPKGYRKTLRFLQNRETPIERDAAVEMVSDAYGFDREAVETAIDHAVKHGRLKQLQDEIDVT